MTPSVPQSCLRNRRKAAMDSASLLTASSESNRNTVSDPSLMPPTKSRMLVPAPSIPSGPQAESMRRRSSHLTSTARRPSLTSLS